MDGFMRDSRLEIVAAKVSAVLSKTQLLTIKPFYHRNESAA